MKSTKPGGSNTCYITFCCEGKCNIAKNKRSQYMVFPNVNPSGLCLTLTQVACVLSTLYLCLKLHAAIFFVLKFVENVLNRSYSIAYNKLKSKQIFETPSVVWMIPSYAFCMGAYGEHCRNRTFCFTANIVR